MRSSANFLSVIPPDLASAEAVSAMLLECFWNAAALFTNTSSRLGTSGDEQRGTRGGVREREREGAEGE